MSTRASLYWSVRRELWENRFIYIVPLVVAALALVGLLISTAHVPAMVRRLAGLDPARQLIVAVTHYGLAASVILLACWIVAVFYCLDALNGERRDRSILFWKSMPVSDLVTVLSKASIPLVVLPLLGCVVVLAVQLAMLLASTAVLLASGLDPATLWKVLPLLQMPVGMFYGMAAHALWFAPVYGWLLLISGWARRATFLWAFLPFFAAFALETLAFGTGYVAAFLKERLTGAMAHAFAPDAMKQPITQLAQLDLLRYLGTPGLWVGLAFAVLFIAAAVHLRRHREPI
jgi:ABC-2 type transport system permease protein